MARSIKFPKKGNATARDRQGIKRPTSAPKKSRNLQDRRKTSLQGRNRARRPGTPVVPS